MKKLFVIGLFSLLTAGCGTGDYAHTQEPRSMVYYGQPVADLYENFGAPTKGVRLSDNERILIYISQEIEKEWAYRYVRGCVMKFHLKDDRVIDWSADGQACVISSADAEEIDEAIQKEKENMPQADLGLFDDTTDTSSPEANDKAISVIPIPNSGSLQLPDDAFDGKASTSYDRQYNVSHLYHYNPETKEIQKIDYPQVKESSVEKSTVIHGKATDIENLQTLPTDAFDGKASVIYIPQMQLEANETPMERAVQQLPTDAFDGQASTLYHTQQINQNVVPAANGHQKTLIPTDAFDGKAEVPTVSVISETQQDDEWGLFE